MLIASMYLFHKKKTCYWNELKIRVINVVDLFKLESDSKHPHGRSDREYDALFTKDVHEAAVPHLEDADLIGGAEAALGRPQDAVGCVLVSLKVQHAVHHVFQHCKAANKKYLLGQIPLKKQSDS